MSGFRRSWLAIASAVVSRASTYVVLIVLARLLPPEDFGAYSIAMVAVTVLSALVSGGGDMWLNRFTRGHGYRVQNRVFSHYLFMALAIAAVVLPLGMAAAPVVERYTSYGGLAAMTVVLGVVMGLAEAVFAVVRARGALAMFFGLRDFLSPLVTLALLAALSPALAAAAQAVQAVVWAAVLVATLAAAAVRGGHMPAPRLPPRRLHRGLALHTLSLMYGNVGSRLSAAVDVLVVSWFIALADVGEYRVGGQFAAGFMIVQHFLFLALPWQLRRLGTAEGRGQVEQRQRLLLALGGVALVVLIAGAGPLLGLLGPRFTEAAALFRVLACIRFAELLWGPQHEIMVSNGLVAEDAHSNVVALLVWPAVFYPLLPVCSPIQAALVAVGLASLARQVYRGRVVAAHGLPAAAGHPLGARFAACGSAVAAALGVLA